MRIRTAIDYYLEHRLHFSAVFLLSGCALAGIPIPLPTGSSITIPIAFPSLMLAGKILAGIGATMGGIGMISKWFKLAPSQADKLNTAVKEAAQTGRAVLVETPPGEADVHVIPVVSNNAP